MKSLNRVVFINSASVKYQDISLDGNVHFIGTQGVGKSTVLRAILFFYNADSQRLGIKPNQTNFSDYYFYKPNSYLIYEVTDNETGFCVLLHKSQNRVCYRFIDTPYNREMIIENGMALELDEILKRLARDGIHHSPKIISYEKYRDIVYGSDREFRRYSLMESGVYHNIPRTIGSIFLNSSLDSDFIKKTIIDSIDDQSLTIELNTYSHFLDNFQNSHNNIAIFKKCEKLADLIIEKFKKIKEAENKRSELAKRVGAAVRTSEIERDTLKARIDENADERRKDEYQLAEIEKQHNSQTERLRELTGQWKGKIREANEKQRHYESIDITAILEKIGLKNGLERELITKTSDKQTLLSEYTSVEEMFKVRFAQLENEKRETETSTDSIRNEIEKKFLVRQNETNDHYRESIKKIETKQQVAESEIKEKIDKAKDEVKEIVFEIKLIDTRRFFEKEIDELQRKIHSIKDEQMNRQMEIKLKEAEVEKVSAKLKNSLIELERTFTSEREKLQNETDTREKERKGIDFKIESGKDSLYGFLNEHYDGWEKTIGKVCNDDILFSNELQPEFKVAEELFYGVKLDLKQIVTKVKTVEEFREDKRILTKKIEELIKRLIALSSKQREDKEKINSRLNREIKTLYREIKTEKELHELAEMQTKKHRLDLTELKEKALREKENAVSKEKENRKRKQTELEHLLASFQELKQLYGKEIEKKEDEKKEKINTLKKNLKQEKAKLKEEFEKSLHSFSKRKEALEEEKYAALQSKGIDTEKIKEVEKRIESITSQLAAIKRLEPTTIEYHKDKRELIDRTDEFNSQKESCETELKGIADQFTKEKQGLLEALKKLRDNIIVLSSKLEGIQQGLHRFYDIFKETSLYGKLKEDIENPGTGAQQGRVEELISSIENLSVGLADQRDLFKQEVNKFTGNFGPENIFHFKTEIQTDRDLLEFANGLEKFLADDKIAEYEKEVETQYSMLVNLITKEVNDLTSREGEIHKTISSINKNFEKSNFVGVVKKIELRMKDSSNRVVQTLKEIKKFGEENLFNIGQIDLFTQGSLDKNNKNAIKLLHQLVEAIKRHHEQYIRLEDSFELDFRVIENKNDTNWVEKLSNIGSNGTDVLVKAMVYIMLLNVFKESATRKSKEFKLHCIIDEIGVLHDKNVKGLIDFANERNILLINGSPNPTDASSYKHIYMFRKDGNNDTRIQKLTSIYE